MKFKQKTEGSVASQKKKFLSIGQMLYSKVLTLV